MECDEELYRKLKSGQLSAFDALYERHKRGLFSFLYGYLKSREESEEVFHEAFMKVLQTKDLDFREGSFKGWLYLVGRNTALNRIRSKARSESATSLLEADSGGTEMESAILDADFAARLQERIAGLPEELSEILRMKLSGLTNLEISKLLRIPVGTIKSRFHAIVSRLREELCP